MLKNHFYNVDVLNSFLLIMSFLLALVLPFHIFLFSYAVLGPLHYLSEIAWLHDKSFFIINKEYVKYLWIGVVLIFFGGLISLQFSAFLILIAFIMTLVLTYNVAKKYLPLILVGSMITALFLVLNPAMVIIFGIMLPTVIHVSVFTIIFMLYGAKNAKSKIGLFNVFLYFIFVATFLILAFTNIVPPSQYVQQNYESSFILLHDTIFSIIDVPFNVQAVFTSTVGIVIMQFITFAYTYHYLNWFSKTSVIGWGRSAQKYQWLILGLWLTAVGIYALDYVTGIIVLGFLSFGHVILELPLNHISFRGLFKK